MRCGGSESEQRARWNSERSVHLGAKWRLFGVVGVL